ncbi:MAG: ribosome-associated translation inhibitor RaiA [Roseiflexaceae bacterium]|nr:ribosome-associated translation inhibitor RaiA [Roseiflexaceae bacterium]
MELIIKSRHGKVSERNRSYIEEKLGKLQRFMDGIEKITVELDEEQRRNDGTIQRAQATLIAEHGVLLRSDQRGADVFTVIDDVSTTLQRQIKRYKEKHWRRGKLRRQGGEIVEVPVLNGVLDTDEAPQPRIVRTKEFQIKPMYSDEAVEQMELLGHTFFVFRDAETSIVNVLYKRGDGNYGLIVAEIGS